MTASARVTYSRTDPDLAVPAVEIRTNLLAMDVVYAVTAETIITGSVDSSIRSFMLQYLVL